MKDADLPAHVPQLGTVARLNLDAGFGYAHDTAGRGTFVFVAERVTHRLMQALRIGRAVAFELDNRGRVLSLVPAQGCALRDGWLG